MPRYELSEGSSNKFWEIALAGKSFTTTYGKIGANGQTTIKKFGSDAEAKKEYDKLIAEKVKKGYGLAGGKKPGKAAESSASKKTAAKPAKNGARYFELSEGSSNKFWEVSVDGTTVRTRYGKIGASGQLTIKEFDSKGEAFKEQDKLIAEKTKKGYEQKGGDGETNDDLGVAKGDARNPALEKAILADPTDENAYSVLADWLQDQGDPRGELIMLQLAKKTKAAAALLVVQATYFFGPLAAYKKCFDGSGKDALLWKYGFIHGLRLAHDTYANEKFDSTLAKVLEMVLSHPSGRFVTELVMNYNDDPNEDTLDDIFAVLAKKAPATIRKIQIGDSVDQISWFHVGNLGKLWKALPNLRTFDIEAGEFELGTIDAPSLEHAVFQTGGLSKQSGKAIANGSMPKLQHLEIYYGDDNYGGDCSVKEVKPLLDRTDLKSLTHLGLKNSMFANDICKALPTAKILKQLKELDLSQGCMTDEGAAILAANRDSFKHLDVLDLTRNFLTKKGIAAVKGIAKNVITKDQEEADMDGDEIHLYVAVGE